MNASSVIIIIVTAIIHSFVFSYSYYNARYEFIQVTSYDKSDLQKKYGGNLHHAIFHMTKGLPSDQLSIVYDISVDILFIHYLTAYLLENTISISVHNITTDLLQDNYFNYLESTISHHLDLNTIYFCTHKMAEHLLLEIYERNLMRRNAIYFFYWGSNKMYRFFMRNLYRNMKVVVITNPRKDAYRLYYSQATSHKKHNIEMYNWWIEGRGLFQHPTLPSAIQIFKDFHNRTIDVPVIHKPPWHFVQYGNETITVEGGRDDKLLRLISEKLNFQYTYFDPPERIQGASFNVNGTFEGVLGLVWQKEAEFFMGDVALTEERTKAVEFSFLTLADSGAFVTHAPSKLNEALALVRPFNWQVWPAIIITVAVAGPVLYMIIALPNSWHPQFLVSDQMRLFYDCAWYTTGIFLKQTMKPPGESNKARIFTILLILSATYVIGDMYAANLTSLLARPGREKPINNLAQLAEAMTLTNYKLLVEKHSSSYSILENGTGIYGRLWQIMNANNQLDTYLVESVERGIIKVRDNLNMAVMGGRETLYFDMQRFGPQYFHLSEKLNTAYSAIALQLGCPYLDNFNKVLMAIFEAGIITKMTQDEYENLGKLKISEAESEEELEQDLADVTMQNTQQNNVNTLQKKKEEDSKLEPINLRMLQGAFYLLGIGCAFSGIILLMEILYYHEDKKYIRRRKMRRPSQIHYGSASTYVHRRVREAMNEAIIATFEYID